MRKKLEEIKEQLQRRRAPGGRDLAPSVNALAVEIWAGFSRAQPGPS